MPQPAGARSRMFPSGASQNTLCDLSGASNATTSQRTSLVSDDLSRNFHATLQCSSFPKRDPQRVAGSRILSCTIEVQNQDNMTSGRNVAQHIKEPICRRFFTPGDQSRRLDFRVDVFQFQIAADCFDLDHRTVFMRFGIKPRTPLSPRVLLDPHGILRHKHIRG